MANECDSMLREIALFLDEDCKSLSEDQHGLFLWMRLMQRRIERVRSEAVQVEGEMTLGELRLEAEAQNGKFRTTDGE